MLKNVNMETGHFWLEYKLLRENCLSTLSKLVKYGNEFMFNDQSEIKIDPGTNINLRLPEDNGSQNH